MQRDMRYYTPRIHETTRSNDVEDLWDYSVRLSPCHRSEIRQKHFFRRIRTGAMHYMLYYVDQSAAVLGTSC